MVTPIDNASYAGWLAKQLVKHADTIGKIAAILAFEQPNVPVVKKGKGDVVNNDNGPQYSTTVVTMNGILLYILLRELYAETFKPGNKADPSLAVFLHGAYHAFHCTLRQTHTLPIFMRSGIDTIPHGEDELYSLRYYFQNGSVRYPAHENHTLHVLYKHLEMSEPLPTPEPDGLRQAGV